MLFWHVKKLPFIIALLLVMPMLSGCIGPKELYERLMTFLKEPQQYAWVKIVVEEDDFGIWDMINTDAAKNTSITFMVQNGTKFLHIFIEVNFSNPLNPDWECLNQGELNFTIITPSDKISKEYCTAFKSHSYDDFIYFVDPQPAKWNLIIKVRGVGKYKILVEAYQPV